MGVEGAAGLEAGKSINASKVLNLMDRAPRVSILFQKNSRNPLKHSALLGQTKKNPVLEDQHSLIFFWEFFRVWSSSGEKRHYD